MLIGPMTDRRSNATTAYGLMSDIAKYILEEPKRVWMGDWVIRGHDNIRDTFEVEGPVCGTVGCIAGNALVLTGKASLHNVEDLALEMLSGGDGNLRWGLDCLFGRVYVEAEYGTQEYALIVVTRIEKFQKEHGAALRAVKITR